MLYKQLRGGSKNNALPYNAKSMPWGGQMAAFPPSANAMYKQGMNNLDAKFYGKLENPFLPDPATSNKALGGGRKTNATEESIKNLRKPEKAEKPKNICVKPSVVMEKNIVVRNAIVKNTEVADAEEEACLNFWLTICQDLVI